MFKKKRAEQNNISMRLSSLYSRAWSTLIALLLIKLTWIILRCTFLCICHATRLILLPNKHSMDINRLLVISLQNYSILSLWSHPIVKSLSCQTKEQECGSCELVRRADRYGKDKLNDLARENVFGAWVQTGGH